MEEVKKYFALGFYFSYGYDLTCSRERRIKASQQWKKEGREVDPLHRLACDHDYFWNKHMCKSLISQAVDWKWLTPVIQGFIGIINGKIQNHDVTFALISRRETLRAGSRFNARGIDDRGNVANFVETEQIVKY